MFTAQSLQNALDEKLSCAAGSVVIFLSCKQLQEACCPVKSIIGPDWGLFFFFF